MEFRILGPLEVVASGGSLPLGGPRQRAVLALLLLHRNEVLPTERIVAELWGATQPATAVKTVQVYLSRFRTALGEGTLERRPTGYVLHARADEVDADRFERLAARAARSEPWQAARTLREALALWRGPALADFANEQFAAAEIVRLEEERLHALEGRIEADLVLARDAELVGELEALVVLHPLRERLRAQLMLALYRSGRQAEALAAYRDARRALRDELGLEPGPALRQLEQQILRQDPALERREPAGDRRRVFVGRERELGGLLAGLADAAAGRGGLFLVSGEPGIGKTRLCEELAACARERGGIVLVGRCWEAGGAPAYWPWVQAIRSLVSGVDPAPLCARLGPDAGFVAQLVPELARFAPESGRSALLESEDARFRLFEATASLLKEAAKDDPLVLVLDDVHAADTPSLLLLRFLAAQLAGARLLVAATYRDVDPAVDEPLSSALAEIAREPVARVLALSGLGKADVARFIELSTGRMPDEHQVLAIHRRTEGNPLFVGELVRLLATGPDAGAIPAGVRTAIGRRLGRLSGECRALLRMASILGREFEIAALELIAGRPSAALLATLEPAIAARLLFETSMGPFRLRFSHALVRDVLYDELPPARRVRLDREAGEALERLYASDPGPHLAEIAHHFAEAAADGDRAKAIDYARRAGDHAAGLLAYEEAAREFEVALRLLDRSGPTRCELLLALGDARARAGDEARAKDAFLRAAADARALAAPELLARAALGYGGRFLWARAGADRQVIHLLREALAGLGSRPSVMRVRVLSRLAGALRDEHEREERDALSREAVASARALDDAATLAYALDARITAMLWPENPQQRLALADELLRLGENAGDLERVVQAHYSRLFALLELGELASVRAELDTVARLARQLRQPAQLWFATVTRATLALFEGRFAEGERLLDEAAALGRRAQGSDAVLSERVQRFTLRWQRGEYEGLEQLLERSVVDYPARPMFRCMLALLHAELGEDARARRVLTGLARGRFAALPLTNEWLFSLGFLAEVAACVEDPDAAALIHELLLPYRSRNGCTADYICTGSVERSLGLTSLAMGEPERAISHLDDARTANAAMGAAPWTARTELDLAAALLRRDRARDRMRAHALLASCAATFQALGMRACRARASRLELVAQRVR
jgi:DNA-binding SARP family transcriptional activator